MKFTIRQARRYADLTETEMAKELGVCRDTYRAIEKNPGICTVKQSEKISEITGVPKENIIFSV